MYFRSSFDKIETVRIKIKNLHCERKINVITLSQEELAGYIDHTNLSPIASKEDIKQTCEEAINYGMKAVCVNSYWTLYASKLLKDSKTRVATVVGFPLGTSATDVKAYEAKAALEDGADEIDMVINSGELISGRYEQVLEDIKVVADTVHEEKGILKVILETSQLTSKQIIKGCEIAEEAGADFVKTSTGFSEAGAEYNDISLMHQTVMNRLGIKASGGIRTYEEAVKMIEHGANRLGLSRSVAILEEAE